MTSVELLSSGALLSKLLSRLKTRMSAENSSPPIQTKRNKIKKFLFIIFPFPECNQNPTKAMLFFILPFMLSLSNH